MSLMCHDYVPKPSASLTRYFPCLIPTCLDQLPDTSPWSCRRFAVDLPSSCRRVAHPASRLPTYDLGNGVNFGDRFVEVKLSASGGEAWKDREAAVLALGAIAEGCISVLYPHLCEEIDLQNNNQLLWTKVVMIISFLLVCACVAVFIVKLV
ncbi:hypothetical protein Q3G72_001004 [Acer saccharum]|nr:hypothetical protein Q3G72_001004 [Acer saccharum]